MSTTMFVSVVMAIIMTITNNTCNLQAKQVATMPEEAIVCEAEAEAEKDGCGSPCYYPRDWEWLEELNEKSMLTKIGFDRDCTIIATIDATVIPEVDEHPLDCFAFVEAMFEDPEGDWYITSEEIDELCQPVWSVTNSRGWKAKLVFTNLDTD